jgi:PAS domain S-box-containing protein
MSRFQLGDTLFQSLIENTSAIVFVMASDTRLLYANPQMLKLLDYSHDELCAKRLTELIVEQQRITLDQTLKRLNNGTQNTTIDVVLHPKNGTPCLIGGILSQWQHAETTGMMFYGSEKTLASDDHTLTALLNNLPGYAYRCLNDEKWTTLIVSKGVTEVTGYPQEDFINQKIDFSNLVHPDDYLNAWEAIQTDLREHRRYEASYRIITALGTERWVLDQGKGMYDANDEIVALEGLTIDVTVQKLMEQALHESEKRTAALLDAVPDMLFRIDKQGKYLDYRIKNYVPRYEIIGKTIHDVLPEAVAAKSQELIDHTLATGEPSLHEYRLTPPEHTLRDYEARIVAISDDEVFSIVRDVTLWRQAEREQRESDERLHVLIANTPVMLIALDLELKFTFARGAVLNRWSLKPDDFIGRSAYEVYQEHPSLIDAIKRASQGQSTTLTLEAGRFAYLVTIAPMVDGQGHLTGVTGVATDISEQHQAEQALREAVNQLMLQYESSRALINANTLEDLLRAFAGHSIEADGCHIALFYVHKDDYGHPNVLELAAKLTPAKSTLSVPDEKLSFHVKDFPMTDELKISSYKMLVSPNIHEERKFFTAENRKLITDFGVKSLGVIPMKLHDQWLGLMVMAWDHPREFRLEERQYYETIAPQFAAALENLLLFEQIETTLENNRRLLATTRYNEDLLRRFVEHMPLEIAMFDTQMRYLVANRRWLTSYNLGDIELIGRSHYEVFPEIQERWKDIHSRCLAGEVIRAEADPFERLDGTIDWVRWEVRPWHTFDGKIGGVAMYTEVINERIRQQKEREKLIEELKTATEKATEASRLKSEFLATMSHELRTPLNTIIGFSGIMLEGIAGTFDDTTRHMLDAIYESGENLLALINDILDISKIEAGWFELVLGNIETQAMVRTWETYLKGLAAKKSLDYEIDIDSNLPPYLIGDRERITQITVNLLSNALKFTDTGKVSLLVHWEEDTLVIEVKDTGIGIPESAMEFIFEAFRQVDSSIRRHYGGTGLGLSIVSRLCQAMGGWVKIHSKLGEGSIFTVSLPLKVR